MASGGAEKVCMPLKHKSERLNYIGGERACSGGEGQELCDGNRGNK